MIFTRFGTAVEIVAYHGKHVPLGGVHAMRLVTVKRQDGGRRYQFAMNLKADDGIDEIDKAVEKAPEETLTGDALKNAIREAQ